MLNIFHAFQFLAISPHAACDVLWLAHVLQWFNGPIVSPIVGKWSSTKVLWSQTRRL